jgi:ATP-binding cassette subfamily B protein
MLNKKGKQSSPFKRAHQAPVIPTGTIRFIFYCLSSFRWLMILMLLMETGQAMANILVPYAIKSIMEGVAASPTLSDTNLIEYLKKPLIFLIGLNVAEIIFSRASGAILIYVGPRMRQKTTKNMFHYLQYHAPRFFAENFAGALAHRISETSMSVNHAIWAVLCEFWPIIITFTVSIFLLFSTHTDLGFLVAIWVFLYISIAYFLAIRCQSYAQNYSAMRSQVNGKIVDSVTNMINAKLFARLDYEREYLDQFLGIELKAISQTFWYMERVRWFQFISAALLKIAIVYHALMLWSMQQISVGEFTMSVGLALLIINEARNLTRRFLEFFEYIGHVANGVESIIREHHITDEAQAYPLTITKGQIEFKNVCFAYESHSPVFNSLNVTLRAGERVGLVGFSGSGKSTFVNLLLRHYEPQSGQILIDGIDIQSVTQDSLHEQISLIPQEPSLFHRSLKENIAYGRLNASDEAIELAAQLAQAHSFIEAMPDNYASLVGERGVKLSGGQRQRIAIARVILKDAPILILDEATSSLDSITEKAIQESLEQIMSQKTVIVIAHRLATIAHLDRILVFENGYLVEDGSHDQLLAQKAVYYRLWSMQAGGFLP